MTDTAQAAGSAVAGRRVVNIHPEAAATEFAELNTYYRERNLLLAHQNRELRQTVEAQAAEIECLRTGAETTDGD